MRIQHNIPAMNSYRNYTGNANALSKNLEKLSSGYKINRAGDDAAGLAISEKMRAQITGLDAAQKNVQDGISLVKTAEGAMQEIHDMLNRMDYLATQSANGTYDNEVDRANLQKEVTSLKDEINRIADSANFNGIKLLDGSLAGDSQVKNVSMDLTVAQKGKYTTGVLAAMDFKTNKLLKEDIGKSIDYTFTWKNASGEEKSTTVSLTFQGDGKGAVADLTSTGTDGAQANYFTDASGNKYYLESNGAMTTTTLSNAIQTALKADKEFANSFDITASSNASFTFEAKNAGSAGAILTGVSAEQNTQLTKTAVFAAATMAGEVTVDSKALDSMQKFNVLNMKVADKNMDAEEIQAKIFEIDGNKFLLAAGGTNKLTDDQIKAIGSDVTIIKIADNAIVATDAQTIATEITRVTGMETKAYNAAPGATTSEGKAGIIAGDITFTQDTLNLSGRAMNLQIGDTSDSFNQMKVKIGDMHTAALGIADLDIGTLEGAQASIDKIRAAINEVSSVRGDLGATQNRLEHTANNLSVMEENIQNAESAIRDTDIADEMTQYTKNNILLQSAQAMLAQANQMPQGVLQLLQ